jgi:hypothetical protein
MILTRAEFKVTGDASPETETNLFQVPVFRCINKGCGACDEEVTGEPVPIEIGRL